MPQVSLTVNGTPHTMAVEGRILLVELLREKFGLSGIHIGCDTNQCDFCVVHVDGQSVKACTVLALQADGACVFHHAAMEQALMADWSADAPRAIATSVDGLSGDMHASAPYRAHLIGVMAQRAMGRS